MQHNCSALSPRLLGSRKELCVLLWHCRGRMRFDQRHPGLYQVEVLLWFSENKNGLPVGGLQERKRGQDRVNPGETCLLPYSGECVVRKTSVLLGHQDLGR